MDELATVVFVVGLAYGPDAFPVYIRSTRPAELFADIIDWGTVTIEPREDLTDALSQRP